MGILWLGRAVTSRCRSGKHDNKWVDCIVWLRGVTADMSWRAGQQTNISLASQCGKPVTSSCSRGIRRAGFTRTTGISRITLGPGGISWIVCIIVRARMFIKMMVVNMVAWPYDARPGCTTGMWAGLLQNYNNNSHCLRYRNGQYYTGMYEYCCSTVY
jgi:hypothetical protein